jgi:GNAT superfamily N-acetyltransferase
MTITYNDAKRDLPFDQLFGLFRLVGWTDESRPLTEEMEKGFMRPWLCSTLVISAWDGDHLVAAVRVLSDTIFRSVIYDLLVDPKYQGKGIGGELIYRCRAHFPNSAWLVGTEQKTTPFYKKLGFMNILEPNVFLSIPSTLF